MESATAIVGTDAYAAQRLYLTETVQVYVNDWRLPKVLVPEKQQEEIRSILLAFQLKFIPEMLLDAVLVKCFVNGPQAAVTSRFSIAAR